MDEQRGMMARAGLLPHGYCFQMVARPAVDHGDCELQTAAPSIDEKRIANEALRCEMGRRLSGTGS